MRKFGSCRVATHNAGTLVADQSTAISSTERGAVSKTTYIAEGAHTFEMTLILTFVATNCPIPGHYTFPYILFVWGYLASLQLYCLQLCLSTIFYVHFLRLGLSSLYFRCLILLSLSMSLATTMVVILPTRLRPRLAVPPVSKVV
jgi:hypothetical protein